jgi:hypothetical protein
MVYKHPRPDTLGPIVCLIRIFPLIIQLNHIRGKAEA